MSFGWTNLISSRMSSSFSRAAHTSPSKSLRVTRRHFSVVLMAIRDSGPFACTFTGQGRQLTGKPQAGAAIARTTRARARRSSDRRGHLSESGGIGHIDPGQDALGQAGCAHARCVPRRPPDRRDVPAALWQRVRAPRRPSPSRSRRRDTSGSAAPGGRSSSRRRTRAAASPRPALSGLRRSLRRVDDDRPHRRQGGGVAPVWTDRVATSMRPAGGWGACAIAGRPIVIGQTPRGLSGLDGYLATGRLDTIWTRPGGWVAKRIMDRGRSLGHPCRCDDLPLSSHRRRARRQPPAREHRHGGTEPALAALRPHCPVQLRDTLELGPRMGPSRWVRSTSLPIGVLRPDEASRSRARWGARARGGRARTGARRRAPVAPGGRDVASARRMCTGDRRR